MVHLNARWKSKVEGLCGNFDGRSNNDGGNNNVDFGNGWKINSRCADAPHPSPKELEPCYVCDFFQPFYKLSYITSLKNIRH